MKDLLARFLDDCKDPIDIVFLLDGALKHVTELAKYDRDNGIIFYRPGTSHRRSDGEALVWGEVNPDRTVLFYDTDMVEGNAMKEAKDYFERLGYERERMFGYLKRGFSETSDGAQLMPIDDLLTEGQKVYGLVREIGHM